MTVDDMIDACVDGYPSGVPVAVVAGKLVAELREKHPAALSEWLDDHAESIVAYQLQRALASYRGRAAHSAKARRFGGAAKDGDTEALSQFAVTYVVDDANTRKTVVDMTGADHRFVAARYEETGNRDLMLAQFHRAVAKKVGRRRTGEVISEDDYALMLASLT